LTVGAGVAMVVVAGVCLMARVTVFDGRWLQLSSPPYGISAEIFFLF